MCQKYPKTREDKFSSGPLLELYADPSRFTTAATRKSVLVVVWVFGVRSGGEVGGFGRNGIGVGSFCEGRGGACARSCRIIMYAIRGVHGAGTGRSSRIRDAAPLPRESWTRGLQCVTD